MHSQVMEVVVRGRLGADLVTSLEGFSVESAGDGLTRVVGPVPDQSMLFGLLEVFEGLHIEVVSVNPVPSRSG